MKGWPWYEHYMIRNIIQHMNGKSSGTFILPLLGMYDRASHSQFEQNTLVSGKVKVRNTKT